MVVLLGGGGNTLRSLRVGVNPKNLVSWLVSAFWPNILGQLWGPIKAICCSVNVDGVVGWEHKWKATYVKGHKSTQLKGCLGKRAWGCTGERTLTVGCKPPCPLTSCLPIHPSTLVHLRLCTQRATSWNFHYILDIFENKNDQKTEFYRFHRFCRIQSGKSRVWWYLLLTSTVQLLEFFSTTQIWHFWHFCTKLTSRGFKIIKKLSCLQWKSNSQKQLSVD